MMVGGKKSVFKEAVIGEQNMKLMALELDDRDKLVIHFLLFCKREIIFQTIFWMAATRNQVPDRAFSWKFL